jgi:hypothetical protein
MQKNLIVALCCLFSQVMLWSQVNDNFSDGDYLNSPAWTGDTAKFDVSVTQELWLNAPVVTDMAYLSTISSSINVASWECKFRLVFNPSSSNYARFYLVSNQQNILNPLNGYFIQMGSTDDDICLYKQSGTTVTKIIDGVNGMLNSATVTCRIKATRDAIGNWQLEADSTGGNTYVSLGSVFDNTYTQSLFTGFSCVYTSTRSDKFYFDDVLITGAAANDTIAPNVVALQIVDSTHLTIDFSEPILASNAENEMNYFISGGIANPSVAIINALDNSKVDLTLNTPILENIMYSISVTAVTDYLGNTMNDTTFSFADFTAQAGDVVINEIMADPSPVVNLPEYEYIELRNNTSLPIQLSGWKFKVNSTIKTLPSFTIQPDSFALLVSNTAVTEFAGLPVIGISSFPSITNNGSVISLFDPTDQLIDEVDFTIDWYNNPNVDDGGYSIEKKNPFDQCGGINNWRATFDINGGTPGRTNSVYTTLLTDLGFKEVNVITSDSIIVIFNKSLDTATVDINDFSIDPSIGSPGQLTFLSVSSVALKLLTGLLPNESYTLTCSTTVADCSNQIPTFPITALIMNYVPAIHDVVINEIMCDESPSVLLPTAEYIELYNRRNFPITLRDFVLISGSSSYTLPSYTLQPDSFVVLIKDVWQQEFVGLPVIPMSSFPSLTNSGQQLSLYAKTGEFLHTVTYSDKWYGNSAKDDGGWSLEQINPNLPCIGKNNWKASENYKGGTPGNRNSVEQIFLDTTSLYAYGVGVKSVDTLLVYLRKSILPSTLSVTQFQISGGIGNPLSVLPVYPELNQLELVLSSSLQLDSIYQLIIQSGMSDCGGNIILKDTFEMAIPDSLESLDVVINEILSDPISDGIDFIEVYNRSTRFIDLKDLYISTADTITGMLESIKMISPTSLIIAPAHYKVFSTDMYQVLKYYQTKDNTAFINLESMPSYSNTEGTVVLSNISQQIIDQVSYNENWHFPLLNSTDGVSLERINPDQTSQDSTNWHSAAMNVGFATPGYKNSQYVYVSPISNQFTVTPEVFSPDQDGVDDVLIIQYQFNDPGYLATIEVYDATGRKVQTIANNQYIGTEGYYSWDGINADGNKARTGIHVISFRVLDPSGKTHEFKKPCVVATRLN